MASPFRELTALRLAAQRVSRPGDLSTPADVARWMLALQSQDLPGARWAIALRLASATDADIEAALASGAIVRSWPMRGTLHIVAPEDLGWMLDIAARRQGTWAARRRSDLEITDAQLVSAGDVAAGLMAGGNCIRRDALLDAWETAGIPTTGQRAYHLLWNLGHEKVLVFGPPDAKQPTFALFDEWVTAHRDLSGDEALAEFATRYFRSHGPATERDFAWWASITLGDARKGIAAAQGLEARDFGGVIHYLAEGLEPAASGVHALPGFDEYMLGYSDRSPALPAEFAQRIVPGNNGMFLPTVVVDGQVVGTWKRTESAKKVVVDLSEFTSMTKKGHAGFQRALARYSEFVGKPVELRNPRPVGEYAPYPLIDDPAAFDLVSTRVETALGSTVARHRAARQSTTATVFLHGAAGSWTTWTPLLIAARESARVIHDPVLFDLPGWGEGELADGARTIDAVAELVRDTLLELGYDDWELVGHSLGGFVALHLAALWPDSVRSVTMVSGTTWSVIESVAHPVTRFSTLPAFVSLWRVMQGLAALGPVGGALVRGMGRMHLLRPAVFPLFRHPFRVASSVIDALGLEIRPRSFAAAAAIAGGYPADTLWASIGCPVTALKGDSDVFVRDSDLTHLTALLPHARTLVLADCGHFAQVERPDEVLAVLPR